MKNFKMIFLTSVFVIILLLFGNTKSQAVLQANPTTHENPIKNPGGTWITAIRQMETVGQTMGLTETLDGLNATSESNGIDVHMMLPTEYEAVVILSASGYGNSGKLLDEANAQKRTTTGNSTGVYFTGDRWEGFASWSAMAETKYVHKTDLRWSDFSTRGWHSGGSWVNMIYAMSGSPDYALSFSPQRYWVVAGGTRSI